MPNVYTILLTKVSSNTPLTQTAHLGISKLKYALDSCTGHTTVIALQLDGLSTNLFEFRVFFQLHVQRGKQRRG